MTTARFAVIEAPSALGLSTRGVETLPDALLGAGFAERLGARRAGRVEPPPHDDRRDEATGGLLNPQGIADYAVTLADAVGRTLDAGEFPVVLGGDCTILIGCLLAARRRGRSGLLFVDGHADFFQPEAEPNGEAASMELALVVGRGPALVADVEGRRPLVREEDVVAIGRRDQEDTEEYGSQRIEESTIDVIDLAAFEQAGAQASAARALERVGAPGLDGFWIHLDADALDDAVMPAVDHRMPGGLGWDDVSLVLRAAMSSGRALGINVTIFNPTLDPDGSIAPKLAAAIADGLRG